jgi:hypothetical protein
MVFVQASDYDSKLVWTRTNPLAAIPQVQHVLVVGDGRRLRGLACDSLRNFPNFIWPVRLYVAPLLTGCTRCKRDDGLGSLQEYGDAVQYDPASDELDPFLRDRCRAFCHAPNGVSFHDVAQCLLGHARND